MNSINADYYHAGLNNDERGKKQESWIQNKTRVIVCTNAFGMGIDKPDIRFDMKIANLNFAPHTFPDKQSPLGATGSESPLRGVGGPKNRKKNYRNSNASFSN